MTHILDLCLQNDIKIDFHRFGYFGWADDATKTIVIPSIHDDFTYIIALHEIGHLIGPKQETIFGKSRDTVYVLERELGAWEYAFSVAEYLTSEMIDFAKDCFRSYLNLYAATTSERYD